MSAASLERRAFRLLFAAAAAAADDVDERRYATSRIITFTR